MGYWKNFQIFCQNYGLNGDKDSSHHAYRMEQLRLP
jgi:hypothetical protein